MITLETGDDIAYGSPPELVIIVEVARSKNDENTKLDQTRILYSNLLRIMISWLLMAVCQATAEVCESAWLGDGHCDRVCMTERDNFDTGDRTTSDCTSQCSLHCSPSLLATPSCDDQCNTWDCAWKQGKCATCAPSCQILQLGNGLCEEECNNWNCGWDVGDCSSQSNPVTVFVGIDIRQGDGSLQNPFNDFAHALNQLFLPYNEVNLLPGTHFLKSTDNPVLLSQRGLIETRIQAAECLTGECDTPVIQLTRYFVSFILSHSVTFSNIRFLGGFDLRSGCWESSCMYCPYTFYNNTIKKWVNDRNEVIDINLFAPQSLCDEYHDKVFITVNEGSKVLFSNMTFERFEQQLQALILNRCGDITFLNVTFDGSMANPNGLDGGLVQHICSTHNLPYCGSILFDGGSVTFLNDGYEYRPDIVFTGFMNIQGIRLLNITNVYFGFTFAMIGYGIDIDLGIHSSLIYITNFRQMEVAHCTFEFGIAEISAAIYIDSNFHFPLIIEDGEATEQKLVHLIMRDSTFVNNTSQRGSLLHMSFKGDNINIVLERLTFTSNIAMLGIVYVKCAQINDEDTDGLIRIVNDQPVLFAPRAIVVSGITAIENYSESLFQLTNLGNFKMSDCVFMHNGESTSGVTLFSDVISIFVNLGRAYANIQPYFPVPLTCTEIISLLNVLNLTFLFNLLDSNYCPWGVFGLALAGTVGDVDVHDYTAVNSFGSGALTLALDEPVTFYNLVCRNNTDPGDKDSVCLDIRMQVPTDVTILDSVFEDNHGWFSTVVFASNTRSLTLQRVLVSSNTAKYTCAGILFNPYPTGSSELVITDSTFEYNDASSFGVVTVMDADQLLSGNSVAHVKVQVSNSTFLRNKSHTEGACISIDQYINLALGSFIRNCTFTENTALNGAALTAGYEVGVLEISHCTFIRNSADDGAAIALTQFYTVDVVTEVHISHCTFIDQRGDHAIAIEGFSVLNDLYSDSNTFRGGVGAFTVTNARVHDQYSIVTGQTAASGAAFQIQIDSEVIVTHLSATNNTALNNGGVFSLTAESYARVQDSELVGNAAKDLGGALFADGDSELSIENVRIAHNTVGGVASAVFVSPGKLTVINVTTIDNYASDYAVFYMSRCSAIVKNSVFRNNTSGRDSPGIVLSNCDFHVVDSDFEDQAGAYGAFLTAIDHNSVLITSSRFRRGAAALLGGAISSTLQSDITIVDSVFEDCTSEAEGGVLLADGCTVTIQNSTFLRSRAPDDGGTVYMRNGVLLIEGSVFDDSRVGALFLEGQDSVSIRNTEFRNCGNNKGGVMEVTNVQRYWLEGNTFFNNSADAGGALNIVFDLNSLGADSHTIISNEFMENSALFYDGGAIAVVNINLNLSSNRFIRNTANFKEANGGAVAIDCEKATWCNVTIANNYFENNQAAGMGGAVSWDDAYPEIQGNVHANNSAKYGSDVSSFPIALAIVTANGSQSDYISYYSEIPVALRIEGIASGQTLLQTVTVGLFDHLKHLVETDDDSTAKMAAWNSSSLLLYGGLDRKAVQGVFQFSEITMISEPGSVQFVTITTNGVDAAKKMKARDPINYYPMLLVEASFRHCQAGESLQNNECFLCVAGTYSLDPSKPCLLCPSAAICYGNNTMVPKPGYWRISNDTDAFIECLDPDACTGSPEPPLISLTGQCAVGYTGNLCQECLPAYSRTGRFQCSRCPNKVSNIAITTLVILLALVLVALIVWTAINSALKPQSLIAIYAKIFMNYLQMVVVSASLNLNWPTFAKVFLNSQQLIGGLAEQMFSFECLFQDTSVSTSSVYFTKLQIYALLPVALLILALITWGALACCRKVHSIFRKLIASLVIILFILHPSITKMMFSLFACMDLGDGRLWLINDLSIVCWESEHMKQILIVVIPTMVVFVFGLPMLSFSFLIWKRFTLESPGMKLMLCFLYKGYQRRRFYWEFVILYRKVAMIAASVFLAPVSIRVQSLTVFAILLFSLFMQVQINPFFDTSLNRLEVKAILVSAITIYSGLYYDTNQINSSIKIFLFTLMVLSNVYFLFTWLRLVSPVLLRTLRDRFSQLFSWRRKYRVQAAGSAISETPDKSSSSAAMFSSDFSQPRASAGNEVSVDHSRHVPSSYEIPANTSVLQREMSEQDEHREMQYTFE